MQGSSDATSQGVERKVLDKTKGKVGYRVDSPMKPG
jgi:hypothetical protein